MNMFLFICLFVVHITIHTFEACLGFSFDWFLTSGVSPSSAPVSVINFSAEEAGINAMSNISQT